MLIRFKSDSSGVGNGFRAGYQTVGVGKKDNAYLFAFFVGLILAIKAS